MLDGQRWLDDPNNPRKAPDDFGNLNSAVLVPEAGRPRVRSAERTLLKSRSSLTWRVLQVDWRVVLVRSTDS